MAESRNFFHVHGMYVPFLIDAFFNPVRKQNEPSESDWSEIKRVLRYLKATCYNTDLNFSLSLYHILEVIMHVFLGIAIVLKKTHQSYENYKFSTQRPKKKKKKYT